MAKGKAVREVKMKRAGKDLWTACVKGNLVGKFYTFDIGNGETPGVFAKAVRREWKPWCHHQLTLNRP